MSGKICNFVHGNEEKNLSYHSCIRATDTATLKASVV